MIPAAATIRRGGASKGSTVSFLIATPENGADSIALSYALLGPFMTIVRPVAALLSAVFSGLLTDTITRHEVADSLPVDAPTKTNGDGCNHSCGSENIDPWTPASLAGAWRRLPHGIRYAVTDLFADIGLWLAIGMVLAAVVNTFVPPGSISQWGSGPLAEETGRLVWQSRGRCEAAGWRADLA